MYYLEKENVRYIVVHCSATPAGVDFSASDIDRWHHDRGFQMIGYHYVVRLDGSVEAGRPLFYQGAHARGYNDKSIGVCYIGGLDAGGTTTDTRTEAQKMTLKNLMEKLKAMFPGAKVVGHRDLDRGKACPCFDAKMYNT